MLANYLKENGISIQHFDGTILEEVIALFDIKTCMYCSLCYVLFVFNDLR
jgi:hypothetical protein